MKTLLIIALIVTNLIQAYSQDDYDPCGEYYHWDANQVNPYENTLIVPDPYGN